MPGATSLPATSRLATMKSTSVGEKSGIAQAVANRHDSNPIKRAGTRNEWSELLISSSQSTTATSNAPDWC